VTQLASSLDLNSLHALSRTCRQFKANLLQYRVQLVKLTLRCTNEKPLPPLGDEAADPQEHRHYIMDSHVNRSGRIASGKVGACARDLVGDCRRCGRTVCRNCTIKPPPPITLPNRHRRLCSVCVKTPLDLLTGQSSSIRSSPTFTTPAFVQEPCKCAEYVYLCQSCGYALSSADTTYKRVWTWRTRYSICLGGIGTGIGEGNEGVKCIRAAHCLGAQDIEVEIDCGAQEFPSRAWSSSGSSEGSLATLDENLENGEKPGYLRQEIEGIGGVVKKKVKKRIRVGKTVKEFEDEREKSEYLEREIKGESRSWCGWCGRVVLGKLDQASNGGI